MGDPDLSSQSVSTMTLNFYTSCIRINGCPILPPLMTETKRAEMIQYKKQALVVEEKLKRCKLLVSLQEKHLQPLRPSSLNLKTKTKPMTPVNNKLPLEVNTNSIVKSSPRYLNSTNKSRHVRSTIENQLANNLDILDDSSFSSSSWTSDRSDKGWKTWSPLKTDSLHDLKLKHDPTNEQEVDTSATITPSSPKLMRQGSYTVLTPSPALVNYIETQKKSNRKTWDLSDAKKKWISESDSDYKIQQKNRNCVSSDNSPRKDYYRSKLSMSSDFDKIQVTTDVVPLRNVPLDQQIQGEEFVSRQHMTYNNVPLNKQATDDEDLPNINNLLLKMKLDHDRQRKELDERQREEQRAAELLLRLQQRLIKSKSFDAQPKSLYTHFEQSSQGNTDRFYNNHVVDEQNNPRRPQSARENYQPVVQMSEVHNRPNTGDVFNIRSRSVEFDLQTPASLYNWRVQRVDNDTPGVISDTDCYSDMSSYSSECRQDISLIEPVSRPVCHFQVPNGQWEKYNKAAVIVTAVSKGFLVRRLLKTVHVQNLIKTLRDAITCATQLHQASDVLDSDVELMHRVGRQIEAAWDEIYNVFFDVSIAERLALITADRERIKNSANKAASSGRSNKARISSATQKSMMRKHLRMVSSYDGSTPTTTRRQRLCCNRMSTSCDENTLRFKSTRLK